MDNKFLDIKKTVYNKLQFDTVVDKSFKTFIKPTPAINTDTVEELFRLYDELYYTIPLEGENNSHQYLIQKSLELTDYEKTTQDLQPLLDEIAQLRQQLLDANQQIFDLENQLTGNAGN